MNEWVSKAANVFKRDVSETPQPFEIHCECGQKHAGIRRARNQHLVCKACGAALFVLPHDTYPPPHVPKTSTKKRKKKKASTKSGKDSLDLSPEQVVDPDEEDSTKSGTSPTKKRKRLNASNPETVLEVESRPNFIVRFFYAIYDFIKGFVEVFWEFWTPYRKLALLIFCFLALTAYYSIRQSRLRGAVDIVKIELDQGLEELNQSNWVEARRHFEEAAAAVDLLKRSDLEANTIRQYLRETTALTRLTSISLIELMETAEKCYVEHGAEKWQQKFQNSYQADWFIIEGYLRPTTDPAAVTKGYDLELVFPIAVGKKQRPVSVQLVFNQAVNLPEVSTSAANEPDEETFAVFAVQFSECLLDSQGDWVLRANPATSFFWVNRATYEATHLHTGSIISLEKQNQMFDLQGNWMGVKQ